MLVRQIFDPKLAQYAYLIGCPASGEGAIVDPERDVDQYFELAEEVGLRIVAAVDTHIHADYLTGLREMAERGIKVYASDEGDADWKYEWLKNSHYDYVLLNDGDTFKVGNILFEAVHTPGHTPEHMAYLVYDKGTGSDVPIGMASGDFVFVGDLGRPDLLETAAGMTGTMEAGARVLYGSVREFKKLPEFVQVWPAHGAGSACGKALGDIPTSTVGYELRSNASIQASETEEAFIRFILSGQPEPPMYFARMKRDNKVGPKVLGGLPQPRRINPDDLVDLAGRSDLVVLDTRLDRTAFMAHHLPGSIYAALDKSFPTVAGSFVEEDLPIYLIVAEDQVEEAVRDLVRIGLDNVKGFATPETLIHYQEQGGKVASTEVLTFADVEKLYKDDNVQMLDVRGVVEFEEGHIEGAQNIADSRLFVRRDELQQGKTQVVYCRTGNRAAASASLLERLGHEVKYVNDLITKWSEPVSSNTQPAS